MAAERSLLLTALFDGPESKLVRAAANQASDGSFKGLGGMQAECWAHPKPTTESTVAILVKEEFLPVMGVQSTEVVKSGNAQKKAGNGAAVGIAFAGIQVF